VCLLLLSQLFFSQCGKESGPINSQDGYARSCNPEILSIDNVDYDKIDEPLLNEDEASKGIFIWSIMSMALALTLTLLAISNNRRLKRKKEILETNEEELF